MASRKTKAKDDTAAATPADKSPTETAVQTRENGATPAEQHEKPSAFATDPSAKMSVSLSDHRGGPTMHLLRSQKFNQMQIRFDGEQPGEQFLAMLNQAGWRDRSEAEGVWTKQIDKNARWQSVDRMEREFKTVANAIRQEKGLAPALEGLGVA